VVAANPRGGGGDRVVSGVTVASSKCLPHAGVLLLSWLFLNARYVLGHWPGSAACVGGGLALLILTDRAFSSPGGPSKPLVGDLLVLVGASGYAACKVMQEKLLGQCLRFSSQNFLVIV